MLCKFYLTNREGDKKHRRKQKHKKTFAFKNIYLLIRPKFGAQAILFSPANWGTLYHSPSIGAHLSSPPDIWGMANIIFSRYWAHIILFPHYCCTANIFFFTHYWVRTHISILSSVGKYSPPRHNNASVHHTGTNHIFFLKTPGTTQCAGAYLFLFSNILSIILKLFMGENI